jgi:hypothetical protein
LKYNEAYLKTNDEQFLLNIVRLRYGDSPVFVDLPNITSQFEASGNGGFAAGLDGQGPGPTRLGTGSLLLRDAPTLSYHPREGREFARALMTPISPEAIRIIRAGANLEQLLLLILNGVNDVDNARESIAMVPNEPDDNEEFRAVVGLIGEMSRRGMLDLSVDVVEDAYSDPVPAGRVYGRDVVDGARDNLVFRASGEAGQAVLKRRKRVLTLEIRPEARASFEAGELARLLNVTPGLDRYVIRSDFLEDDEEDPALPGALGDDDIALNTRSILQIMTFLSKGVCLPEEHEARGVAPTLRGPDGCPYDWTRVTAGVFRVHSSKHRPKEAEVAVKYKDYWFYVREDDPVSRSTITALDLLNGIQQSSDEESGPILTLPVGG